MYPQYNPSNVSCQSYSSFRHSVIHPVLAAALHLMFSLVQF